jgi:hypothetical protein
MLNIRFGALRAGAASHYCSGSAKKMQLLAAPAPQNWSLRWNLRPPKNCLWPEKIRGNKMAEFGKKVAEKRPEIFLQTFR